MDLTVFFISVAFVLGYLAIIFEHTIKVHKTASALLLAVVCWLIYFVSGQDLLSEELKNLGEHLSDVSQIIFFLLGAMVLVELIDSHKGFKIITDLITTSSKRKMLWIISLVAFFLSAILDNLTTTILMISLLRKIVPVREERFLLGCMVVVAANAGGAWTPIGDVTTTMLWINGQISTFVVMKALFLPSLISLLVPLCIYTSRLKGKYTPASDSIKNERPEPGSRLVFWLGVGLLVFVPIFKTLTGLPPFMGIFFALAVLWIVTDLLHQDLKQRTHLTIPHILTRIDTSGVLFFLGILLCINALETVGILKDVAVWLQTHVQNEPLIATFIGIISAVIDNVPLVAATIGMYPLSSVPMDSSFWLMIAYAAGTGGSLLVIGSSSGIALMGMEKIDFVAYFKKATFPILLGYLAGMGAYLLL